MVIARKRKMCCEPVVTISSISLVHFFLVLVLSCVNGAFMVGLQWCHSVLVCLACKRNVFGTLTEQLEGVLRFQGVPFHIAWCLLVWLRHRLL